MIRLTLAIYSLLLISACTSNKKQISINDESFDYIPICKDSMDTFYKFDGYCEYFSLNDSIKIAEGSFLEGKKHGKFIEYYENGKVEKRGEFIKGLKHMLHEKFYKNGNRKERALYNILGLGDDNQFKSHLEFKSHLVGIARYDTNGVLLPEESYYYNIEVLKKTPDSIYLKLVYNIPYYGDSMICVYGNFDIFLEQKGKVWRKQINQKSCELYLSIPKQDFLRGYIVDYDLSQQKLDSHILYISKYFN